MNPQMGDLVSYGVGCTGRVCGVNGYKVTVSNMKDGKEWFTELPAVSVRPIPLSDKLLEKNGFKRITSRCLVSGAVRLTYWDRFWELQLETCEVKLTCHVKFLHKLQHLLNEFNIYINFEL